jgi:hypothetical protein
VNRDAAHPPGRVFAALPDAVSCAMFLLVWFAPGVPGAVWVKNLMVTMLLEFLTVHSGGFIGTTVANPEASRLAKTRVVLGFGSLYLLFAGAFSLAFEAWWPLAVFAWLLLAKLAVVWLAPLPTAQEQARQTAFTGFAIGGYVLGVMLTSILPVPRFAIDDAVATAAAIPGSGLWVDEPHRVIAFGALYFGFMAWAKGSWQPGSGAFAATAKRAR